MRRLGHAFGLAALLAAAVACGGNEEIGFGGSGSTTTTTTPPSTESNAPDGVPGAFAAPTGSTEITADKVDFTALPEGYPHTVWIVGDGTTVGLYGQAGGCTTAAAEVAEQGAQRVVLRVVETTTGDQVCTLDLRYPPLTVKLDAPLGTRTVVLERSQVGPR